MKKEIKIILYLIALLQLIITIIVLLFLNLSLTNLLSNYFFYQSFILFSSISLLCYLSKFKSSSEIDNSLFSKIVKKSGNGAFISDLNGNIKWMNDSFREFYCKTGIDCGNITALLDDELFLENFTNVVNNKKPLNFQHEFIHNNGKTKWMFTYLNFLDDSNGNKFITGISSDISQLKVAEEEIAKQKRELSMQADMLSLINAQMEVQRAGAMEQNEMLHQQHEELELKNQQIRDINKHLTDSIRYAKTIQEAILPSKEQLNNEVFAYSIIYKPKDIVSGDFYWYNKVQNQDLLYHFIVLSDCTGHGVPGAFMSMIGNQMLNELIIEQQKTNPADILKYLHLYIVKALNQKKSENEDGMDMSICRFHKTNNQINIVFAGAKHNLIIKKKGAERIQIIKGDRNSLGGHVIAYKSHAFTNNELICNSDDLIYMYSDGFIDQNNRQRKRIGSNNFYMLIDEISNLDIAVQNTKMEDYLKDWQKKESQRDDISILIVKFK